MLINEKIIFRIRTFFAGKSVFVFFSLDLWTKTNSQKNSRNLDCPRTKFIILDELLSTQFFVLSFGGYTYLYKSSLNYIYYWNSTDLYFNVILFNSIKKFRLKFKIRVIYDRVKKNLCCVSNDMKFWIVIFD